MSVDGEHINSTIFLYQSPTNTQSVLRGVLEFKSLSIKLEYNHGSLPVQVEMKDAGTGVKRIVMYV